MLNIFGGFFPIVLIIILFVTVFSRLSYLNARISSLERRASAAPEKSPAPVAEPNFQAPITSTGNPPVSIPTSPNQYEQVVYGPTAVDKFIDWLRDDWLLKLGGFLLLIGLGWFTTYAFVNNWIGPAGRITLGIVAGIIILALGTWRIRKYINQGGIFLVIGSTVILLTTFAAREYYDMFTPISALLIMFIATAYIYLVSVKYDSFAVSLSGLVLSFVAPQLTNGFKGEIETFAYLFVVTLGAIWIVAIKNNWGALILASLVGVSLYSLSIVSSSHYHNTGDILIWMAYGFAAVFFLASIINIINSRESDIKSFLWTAVLNGGFLLFWIMSLVSKEWQSSIIALWMAIFAVGAFIAFSVTKLKSVFFVYAGVAAAMLVVATSLELYTNTTALVIAFTVEAFIIPVLVYFATRDLTATVVSSMLIMGPTLLSLGNLDSYYRGYLVFSEHFFVVALLIISLMALGIMFKKIKDSSVSNDFYPDNFYLILGSGYAYVLLWSVLHVAIREPAVAVTMSLVIFIIIGLVKYFYGIFIGSHALRNYGGVLIAFVIMRLLFIDVWQMEMSAKIFVFVLVGVLLMSTAFFSRQIKSGFTSVSNH